MDPKVCQTMEDVVCCRRDQLPQAHGRHQDQLHNLQGPVQNENVGPLLRN